jgi:hypothetical protein
VNIVKYTTILSIVRLFGMYKIFLQKCKCAKNESVIIICSVFSLLFPAFFHRIVKNLRKMGLAFSEIVA